MKCVYVCLVFAYACYIITAQHINPYIFLICIMLLNMLNHGIKMCSVYVSLHAVFAIVVFGPYLDLWY